MKAGDLLSGNSYSDLLRTEEWKEFASAFRRRRGNFCECCKQGNKETQVHHIYYEPGKKPWEARDEDLMVLCDICHKGLTLALREFRKTCFRFLTPSNFEQLNSALLIGLTQSDPTEFVHAVREMAISPSSIQRFAYWNSGGKPKETLATTGHAYNATERDYKEKH